MDKQLINDGSIKTTGEIVFLNDNYVEKETLHLLEFLSSKTFNIENLCRICLSTSNSEMSTLVKSQNCELLAEMFTSVTAISIIPNDGLPTKVCGLCKHQLIQSHEFKQRCSHSDMTLKSLKKLFDKEEIKNNDEKNKQIQEACEEKPNIKNESEMHIDIEYLEDFCEIEDNSTNFLKNIQDAKRDITDVKLEDPKDLLVIVPEKKTKKTKHKPHVCDFCSQMFTKARSLRLHIKHKHGPTLHSHSCNQCKESFTNEHDLKLHSVLHSDDNVWKCSKCDKVFTAKSILRRHIQRHMQSKRYSCESCGKSFVEMYALRRHLRVHTGERLEKKYSCQMCDKKYSSRSQLRWHLWSHEGLRPCACACGKRFPSARLLASHELTHDDRKPHQCSYCDKRFRHESTRNTHHRTHTGEKPYVCSICGKTFIQNSNLTLHMRTHTGERPYKCDTCDRKFSSGSALKNHLRIHTGEKPYCCQICGKRFARMAMTSHMRQHTGERPFECTFCPKKFITAARLKEHCRVHTGEKPFECAKCNQKFPTKSHLVKHIKTHNTKKKTKVVVLQQLENGESYLMADKYVISNDNVIKVSEADPTVKSETVEINKSDEEQDINTVTISEQIPLEVTGELVLNDDSNINTNILVVDNSPTEMQAGNVCLTSGVNFVNSDMNYTNDVNLVTVNEGEVSISSSAMLEGATVKLYQLDQSLVQIHSTAGQVTISKITSKMTANF